MEAKTATSESYFSTTKQAISDYLESRWELIKLEVTDKSANILSLLFIALGAICFLIYIVFSLSMLLGYWFSHMTDSYAGGFGILTGIYFLIILMLWFGRHGIVKRIANTGIKMVFSNKDNSNDKSKD